MAKLSVKPTRMELSKLKRRLKTAVRGHKVLKDKQDELMRRFIDLVRENNRLRQTVETQLIQALQSFVLARALLPEIFIEEVMELPTRRVELHLFEKTIMNVTVPQMTFDVVGDGHKHDVDYGFLNSNSELDDALTQLKDALEPLLSLTEIEKMCQLLADEIEKTRRRVNALEHRMIPQLEETIAAIQMKLEEQERASLSRVMKVKQLTSQ